MKKILLSILLLFVIVLAKAQAPAECSGKDGIPMKEGLENFTPFSPGNSGFTDREPPRFQGDRIVYWVHGLGGGPESWAQVGSATQHQQPGQQIAGYKPRKVTSLFPDYFEFSFNTAATSFHNNIVSIGDPTCAANGITDKKDNFIIAHSQGGLVSRATDKMYHDLGKEDERRFGGIVTFGTAHGGAYILNNELMINELATKGCEIFARIFYLENLQKKAIVDFILPDQFLEDATNKLCNFFGESILPIAFKDQQQPITEDYKVGAAPLEELNNYTTTLPAVAFFGVEQEPVFYRLMYNLTVKKPNEFPPFESNYDQLLVDKSNNLTNKFRVEYELNRSFVESLESLGMPCDWEEWILNFTNCQLFDHIYWQKLDRRNAWKNGYDYVSSLNNNWKKVIGARTEALEFGEESFCACQDNNGELITFSVASPADCPQECSMITAPVMSLNITEKPNDGVALAESAAAFPGAKSFELIGSNHQQMRNDKNTKSRLNEVFDGSHAAYFTTATRN